jgi:hypothetical protein
MPIDREPEEKDAAVSLLTELAVEGTSSVVETQRTLLELAQQENNLVLKALKERVSGFLPAAAMADFIRRSVDTLIQMQQELLTATSRQTAEWLGSETATVSERTAQLIEFAKEGLESFAKAQTMFLKAVSEESERAMRCKPGDFEKGKMAVELKQLACDAGNAFLEAQKRLLDIANQQVQVNLNAASRTAELLSPEQLMPVATLAGDSVKSFFDAQAALVSSMIKTRSHEPTAASKKKTSRARRRQQPAAA